MNCWEVLGIEETVEEVKIREAYRQKLPGFHPEEDPEGFRRLRRALEDALACAAALQVQQESEEGRAKEVEMLDNREVRELLKKAEGIYQDYARRIVPEEWETLISCQVCQDLETQREAGWALLSFFMDHFYLPQPCCAVMDKLFGWSGEEEELKQHFPEMFVDRLLEKLEKGDGFRFYRMPLHQDIDYEQYIRTYFTLQRALWDRDKEGVEKNLALMDAMGVEHPDLTILRIRHLFMSGKEEEAWALAKGLYAIDKEHPASAFWYFRIALDVEDSGVSSEEMEEGISRLVREDEENPGYWQLLGDFLCRENRLEEGLKVLGQAYECSGREWENVYDKMIKVADALSRQMEEAGKADWELVNICWRAQRYDKVRALLEQVEPPEGRENAWMIMMAGSCHELGDYEMAWKCRKAVWDSFDEEDRVLALYLDLAEDCGCSGRIEEGLTLYREAEKKFGESAELAYLQARMLFDAERGEEAFELCEKSLKLDFLQKAFNLRIEILFSRRDYAQVKEDTGELIRQGSQSAQVAFDYAKALRKLEEFEEAEQVLKKLEEKSGGLDIVQQELAALYYDMDKTEEALVWIDRAIAQKDSLWRQMMRADYLRDMERYEEETAVYRQLMGKGSEYEHSYISFRMGRALEELGKFEEAEMYFKKALERDGYSAAWDGLGDVLQKQKKWEEAEAAYKEGIKGKDIQAARDLCRLLKRVHKNKEAEEWVQAVLKQWPEDKSLLIICSDILIRNKKHDEAIRCLNRYSELYPAKTAYAYQEIALCYENAKDFVKAREYYQKAIDHDPGDAKSWRLMGKFLSNELKDQETALGFLITAVELAEDSTYGWMKLGEVYEALGNQDEAFRCYERSLENYQKKLDKNPNNCCNCEGMADVLLHLGRFEEAHEMIERAQSLESRVFNCSKPFCYEAVEDLAKIEERKGNLKKAIEWMEVAGTYGTTDYYPREIARLRAAMDAQQME